MGNLRTPATMVPCSFGFHILCHIRPVALLSHTPAEVMKARWEENRSMRKASLIWYRAIISLTGEPTHYQKPVSNSSDVWRNLGGEAVVRVWSGWKHEVTEVLCSLSPTFTLLPLFKSCLLGLASLNGRVCTLSKPVLNFPLFYGRFGFTKGKVVPPKALKTL